MDLSAADCMSSYNVFDDDRLYEMLEDDMQSIENISNYPSSSASPSSAGSTTFTELLNLNSCLLEDFFLLSSPSLSAAPPPLSSSSSSSSNSYSSSSTSSTCFTNDLNISINNNNINYNTSSNSLDYSSTASTPYSSPGSSPITPPLPALNMRAASFASSLSLCPPNPLNNLLTTTTISNNSSSNNNNNVIISHNSNNNFTNNMAKQQQTVNQQGAGDLIIGCGGSGNFTLNQVVNPAEINRFYPMVTVSNNTSNNFSHFTSFSNTHKPEPVISKSKPIINLKRLNPNANFTLNSSNGGNSINNKRKKFDDADDEHRLSPNNKCSASAIFSSLSSASSTPSIMGFKSNSINTTTSPSSEKMVITTAKIESLFTNLKSVNKANISGTGSVIKVTANNNSTKENNLVDLKMTTNNVSDSSKLGDSNNFVINTQKNNVKTVIQYVSSQHANINSNINSNSNSNSSSSPYSENSVLNCNSSEFGARNNNKNSNNNDEKVFPKPPYSYSCLTAMALRNSDSGTLQVNDIYEFIIENFPYYKTARDGWKNSIRHNLSLNKCFEKIENPTGGSKKGCLWALNKEKLYKLEDECKRCRQRDPVNIRLSMSRPDDLSKIERGEQRIKKCSVFNQNQQTQRMLLVEKEILSNINKNTTNNSPNGSTNNININSNNINITNVKLLL